MLTDAALERILTALPRLRVGVLGDLFLDRYLDIDARLTEPSIETGLDAYQVARVRAMPGAAGTVVNNLAALGVGSILPIAVIGDDGEGYELRQALARMPAIDPAGIISTPQRRTPTYTKPMLETPGAPPRELNRLDIKNREPLPTAMEEQVSAALDRFGPGLDALLVVDQVSEENCGVVTARVRRTLEVFAAARPECWIIADSRERIRLFRAVCLKPNERECRAADPIAPSLEKAVHVMAFRARRPVFCTRGEHGILVADGDTLHEVPAYPIVGPIDTVGAGDSTNAGLICALAAGATLTEAAAFANLVANITVRQIGTTGTASPEQVRECWRAVQARG